VSKMRSSHSFAVNSSRRYCRRNRNSDETLRSM